MPRGRVISPEPLMLGKLQRQLKLLCGIHWRAVAGGRGLYDASRMFGRTDTEQCMKPDRDWKQAMPTTLLNKDTFGWEKRFLAQT